jgi:hypothetical protein
MPLALLTFVTGIAISIIAIYYSVLGLAAIFAAAMIPIIVMGTVLEISKLVTAWWLKANWHRAPLAIKSYLTVAVVVLMIITSMGIFGFLSKAHTDQAVPLGDTAAKVSFIDEKINNERETIANARVLIKQLDDAVIGIQSGEGRELRNRDGTTRIENPAERALQVRRSQAKDRAALTKTIDEAQARIVTLQEEKAPIAGKLRAVEAEVGPIKYIAKLIYGDNPDQNVLEKAVTWVIIIIVLVFDPLAVLLLLASQLSFQWARQERDQKMLAQQLDQQDKDDEPDPIDNAEEPQAEQLVEPENDLIEEANAKLAEIEPETDIETTLASVEQVIEQEEKSAIEEWNEMIAEAEREVEKEKSPKQKWKEDHPDQTIKFQEKLKDNGVIDTLPWEIAEEAAKSGKYQIFPELQTDTQTKPDPDFPKQDRVKPDFTEVIEPEGSKKKNYIVKQEEHQIKKTRE